MDLATVIGLALGLIGIFGGSLIEGGSPMALVQLPAAMIVFGGTIGATFISFPMQRIAGLLKFIAQAFKKPAVNEEEIVTLFVRMADKARREGLLSLEDDAQKIHDEFLRQGML